MRGISMMAAALAAFVLIPASAQADKAKEWCTNAHMQKMDAMVAKMTDPAQQKQARSQLAMSKEAMEAHDMSGCVEHMQEAHKAMGL